MSRFVSQQMIEVRNSLIKEIRSLSDEDFNHRNDENPWSIAQICQHIALVDKATIKTIVVGLRDMESPQTERKNVQLLLDRTRKVKAPKMVVPEEKNFTVDVILDLLHSSRKELTDYLGTLKEEAPLTKKTMPHPAFGKLSLDQWIEMIPYHEQRHIEQIKEMKLRNRKMSQ